VKSRLAVLVPVLRLNMIRFHGLLGPTAKWRTAIVSACPEDGQESDTRKWGNAWADTLLSKFLCGL